MRTRLLAVAGIALLVLTVGVERRRRAAPPCRILRCRVRGADDIETVRSRPAVRRPIQAGPISAATIDDYFQTKGATAGLGFVTGYGIGYQNPLNGDSIQVIGCFASVLSGSSMRHSEGTAQSIRGRSRVMPCRRSA
jgi:hypothetical protein